MQKLHWCGVSLCVGMSLAGCGKGDAPATVAAGPAVADVVRDPAPQTYSGDGLTLTLNGANPPGSAQLTLDGNTYPATVESQSGDTLQGTFTNDGKPFQWSAQKHGDTLAFSTSGSDYALKLQSSDADNPLAKKSKPIEVAAEEPITARPAVNSRPAVSDAKAVRMARLSVKDPGINNIEAVSFLVPQGWQSEGGIQWFHDLSILAMLLMKVTDPQTGAQIEYLPIQNFTLLNNPVFPMNEGTNYMGNIVWHPITDAGELVQTFYTEKYATHLKDVTPVGEQDLPKVAEMQQRAYGGESKARSQRVRYKYDVSGKPWEEDVYLTSVYTPTQLGVFWSITSAYACRAPAGTLDALTPLMQSTVMSAKLSQDWFSGYMYVQKLFRDRMMQGIRDATALSQTITKNNEEIRQMYADAYKERQDSQDRINQQFGEVIRGVETYHNPYELSLIHI